MGDAVRPPAAIQRRAWECAYVLREEFADRLTPEQNIRAEIARFVHPDRLGLGEACDMIALYHVRVDARV